MKVSLNLHVLGFTRPRPFLSRTLPVLLSLCGAVYATETIVTNENFSELGMDSTATWNIVDGDVIEFQTTSEDLEVHRLFTNDYLDDKDETLKENGTLKLAEGALVNIAATDDASRRIQVGKVEMAANSTLRLNAYMAVTGSTNDETYAFTMGSGAQIELGGGAEMAVVPMLHMGEYPENPLSSYTEIRKAEGAEHALITNTLSQDVHLSYVEEKGIKMEGVYFSAYGVYNLYIEAVLTDSVVRNVTQGKTVEMRNGDSQIRQVDAQTGDIKLLNQSSQIKMESIHIGSAFEGEIGENRVVSIKTEDGGSSTVSLVGINNVKGGLQTDVGYPPGLVATGSGAQLDANLELVTTRDNSIMLSLNEKEGLNLCGNALTLGEGLDLLNIASHTRSFEGDTLLLFTNVDSLTLQTGTETKVYDDTYFDYESGLVAASDFFSSDNTTDWGPANSIPELTRREVEGGGGYYLEGWFLEYNPMADNASLGSVSLVYQSVYLPEPTTATLSLLALAALASRRRRR